MAKELSSPIASRCSGADTFDQYVRRYHRQAYNIAYRLAGNHSDAEDITQEAFIRAFRFFDRYNRALPFENWLYRIISNVFVDEIRRRPKAKLQSLDQPVNVRSTSGEVNLEIPDNTTNPERMSLESAIDEPLQRALNALPPDFRQAVILADIEGMSYEEIAESMGCSLGTVRSRLHRGRKMMRNRLTAQSYVPAGRAGGSA
ncbi:MAG: sigma-70 family RNA polymerase sigma factor [Chthonomonadales bacterium]|nr:sigma-70 family RNA polymerase sigma factor [Chthonomonadales bacterium]